jgi:hypothetical protein
LVITSHTYRWINEPWNLGQEDLALIEAVIKHSPSYFVPRATLARAAVNTGHPLAAKYIAHAALSVPDRKWLQDYISLSKPEEELSETLVELPPQTAPILAEDLSAAVNMLNSPLEASEQSTDQLLGLSPNTPVYDIENIFGPPAIDYQEKIEVITHTRSFSSWLSHSQTAPTDIDVIDAFLSGSQEQATRKTVPHEIIQKSIIDQTDYVTETLARVHAMQRNFTKAIEIYEQLSLKIPEKSGYFATQIKILRDNIKDN